MSQAGKVGLIGFYGHGNFGDDMGAVLIGLHLKRLGVPFSIFRLCAAYAKQFALPVSQTAEELLDGTSLLLWGSGGLLVPWSGATYRLLFPRAADDFDRVISLAQSRGIRFRACSVGGTGEPGRELSPAYKRNFLRQAEYLTVRNPQDLQLLRQSGKQGEFFPDIMWQVSEHFRVERKRGTRRRVGMDLYFSNLLRRGFGHLIPALASAVRARNDCEFIFIDTTHASRKPYRGLARLIGGANIDRYQFCDPARDLELLASLDLLVSTRLHAPLVAMQYGVPVLSLAGERKTTLLFENLGMPQACYDRSRSTEFLSLFRGGTALDRYIEHFAFPDVAALRAASRGHLERLTGCAPIAPSPRS